MPSDLYIIHRMTLEWGTLQSQIGGYNQLIANLEDVPDDYQELVRKLNFTYRSPKEWLELYTKNNQELSFIYSNYLVNNQPWYSQDNFSNEISPAQIEYYKNNPKFKSRIMESMHALTGLMWAHDSHRGHITDVYVSINDLLGDKVITLPNEIRNTSLKTEQDALSYIGIYDEPSDAPNGRTIEIIAEGKDLYIRNAEGRNIKEKLIYFHEEKPWFGYSSTLILFDEEDKNALRIINGRRKTAVYKRKKRQ